MVKRKKSTIDAGIPWYRDLSLSTKEIIVGRVCLSCGEIIGEELNGTCANKQRHSECQKEHRKKLQLKSSQKRNPPQYLNKKKYCVDCGKELRKSKVISSLANRCDWCQFLKTKQNQKKYVRNDREITVGVGCIICGKFTPAKNYNKKYCDDCKDGNKRITESEINSQEDKYNTAMEYMKKHGRIKTKKPTGTYDTSPSHIGNVEHMKTKNNKPNFEQERKAVSKIKNETLKSSKYHGQYSVCEGDVIRGDAFNYKKKNEE